MSAGSASYGATTVMSPPSDAEATAPALPTHTSPSSGPTPESAFTTPTPASGAESGSAESNPVAADAIAPAPGAHEGEPGFPGFAGLPPVAEAPSNGFEAPAAAPAAPAAAAPHIASAKRHRRWPMLAGAGALLLVCVGAGGYAYAAHYEDVAVPGTTVAGMDVAGMSRDDIVDAIKNKAGNASVNISGDVTTTATLADLGTTIDAEATADTVMARGESVPDRFTALLSDGQVTVVTTTDDSVTTAYAESLIPADQAVARNASITLDDENTTFVVSPGSEGTSVDSDALKNAAATAATSLSSADVSVTYETKAPAVSDADAQTVADKANGWVTQDVTVTGADHESYTADNATKASWITVTASESAAPTISVDSSKVSEWVDAQVEDVNEEPVTGKRNVDSQGKEVAISVDAVDGREVTNADTVDEGIVDALSGGKSYSGSFETKELKATWEERKIAAGAENLPYQATDGEKWIDINLSSKTVTAYEGATVVHGPVSVVDGAAATPTVTGTYRIYQQNETQTMRGENADGSNYETENVPWISYFYQGYALHGAYWRSSFGYSDSHGCLNMPVDEAHWIYNWAEKGTTVTSHF